MLDFRGIWSFVFNLADVWINVGVFMLIVDYFILHRNENRGGRNNDVSRNYFCFAKILGFTWVSTGKPYDIEKGAGTFNPNTFLMSLGL